MELTEWERKSHQNDCGHKKYKILQNAYAHFKIYENDLHLNCHRMHASKKDCV